MQQCYAVVSVNGTSAEQRSIVRVCKSVESLCSTFQVDSASRSNGSIAEATTPAAAPAAANSVNARFKRLTKGANGNLRSMTPSSYGQQPSSLQSYGLMVMTDPDDCIKVRLLPILYRGGGCCGGCGSSGESRCDRNSGPNLLRKQSALRKSAGPDLATRHYGFFTQNSSLSWRLSSSSTHS